MSRFYLPSDDMDFGSMTQTMTMTTSAPVAPLAGGTRFEAPRNTALGVVVLVFVIVALALVLALPTGACVWVYRKKHARLLNAAPVQSD